MKKILLSIAVLINVLASMAQVTLTLQPDACVGKDALIADNIIGNLNYGNHEDFSAVSWTCGGSPCHGTNLLQFDLSFIPQGSVISSATLSLYANLTSGNGYAGTPTWGTDNASYLNRVTAPWAESTVTWSTQPTTTNTGQVNLPQSTTTAQDYPNIDITGFVQYWNQNPTQNFGMMIAMINQNAYNSLIFCSSDYPDSTKRPKLVITYTPPQNACINVQPQGCVGKDALIADNIIGNLNYGNHEDFSAVSWTCGGSPCHGTNLLQFDLSFIPQGSVISSATLSLYANLTSGNGYAGTPTWGTDNASYLNRVTAPWAESTVTWSTQPTTTNTGQVNLPQSTTTAQDYPNIDITGFVQYWNQNPTQNFGMMIAMINQNAYNSLIFCSSDYPDSTKRPKLEICFSIPSSVLEINSRFDIKIYPNPATNQLTINLSGLQAEQVSIYNVDGKLVNETKQPANNSIDISGLAKGVYVAEVKVRNTVQRVRWVKM